MSQTADRLARAHTDLDQILKHVETGTSDHRRHVRRVDLTKSHLDDWASTRPPANTGPRGGTTTIREAEDRDEEQRLARQILNDRDRLDELARRIENDARDLAVIVARYASTIDLGKLPRDHDVPGCKSCARTTLRNGVTIGRHFAPIRPDVPGHGLCDWCYRYALARAEGHPITSEHYPPIEACDLFHTQSPRAAGLWLAKTEEHRVSA